MCKETGESITHIRLRHKEELIYIPLKLPIISRLNNSKQFTFKGTRYTPDGVNTPASTGNVLHFYTLLLDKANIVITYTRNYINNLTAYVLTEYRVIFYEPTPYTLQIDIGKNNYIYTISKVLNHGTNHILVVNNPIPYTYKIQGSIAVRANLD